MVNIKYVKKSASKAKASPNGSNASTNSSPTKSSPAKSSPTRAARTRARRKAKDDKSAIARDTIKAALEKAPEGIDKNALKKSLAKATSVQPVVRPPNNGRFPGRQLISWNCM